MYELKKNGKVFASWDRALVLWKKIYRDAVSQRLRNTSVEKSWIRVQKKLLPEALLLSRWTPANPSAQDYYVPTTVAKPFYRYADKSLPRPGRKKANVSVRMA